MTSSYGQQRDDGADDTDGHGTKLRNHDHKYEAGNGFDQKPAIWQV